MFSLPDIEPRFARYGTARHGAARYSTVPVT